MKLILLGMAMTLVAFSSHDVGDAASCGVTEAQLRNGMENASKMKPHSGHKLGQCNLIVDDARNVSIITPKIQRSVEKMKAREKAEAGK